MIDLRSGVPGSGKTLSAVEALAKMIARWEKHPLEARAIFVHGVKDLALPHSPMPLTLYRTESDAKTGKPGREVPDWDAVPDGSYILIDECQTLLPPRGSASEAPPYIAALNTHRHRGLDITLITQHPKLIDHGARALVGKHQHFRRLFGSKRAAVYEWDACSDGLSGLSNAVTSYYPYPAKAFEWYKSAEIHTKQSFRLPRWIVIPFVGLALGAITFPMAYSRVMSMANPEKARASILSAAAPASAASGAVAPAPHVPVSPVAGAIAVVEKILPRRVVAGCVATVARCTCMETNGSLSTDVTESQCREASTTLGGIVPYDMAPRQAAVAMASPVPVEPLSRPPVSIGGGSMGDRLPTIGAAPR